MSSFTFFGYLEMAFEWHNFFLLCYNVLCILKHFSTLPIIPEHLSTNASTFDHFQTIQYVLPSRKSLNYICNVVLLTLYVIPLSTLYRYQLFRCECNFGWSGFLCNKSKVHIRMYPCSRGLLYILFFCIV